VHSYSYCSDSKRSVSTPPGGGAGTNGFQERENEETEGSENPSTSPQAERPEYDYVTTEAGGTLAGLLAAIDSCKYELEFRRRQLSDFERAVSRAATDSDREVAEAKVNYARDKLAKANTKMETLQKRRRAAT
jgi:hypothetical protein